MKKNYKTLQVFIVLLCAVSMKLGAQLNGLYTINSTIPTGGTNFQTFTAFASAINSQGVSGPVTVDVAVGTGPYTEQPLFNQATGVSSTNSVLINGNGNVLTFASASSVQRWTLGLNGADYMTFNNLNIYGTGNTYALTVHLWNLANNNRFNNCTITAPMNLSTSFVVPVSISGSQTSATSSGPSGNDNIFDGCTITGGYYGVVFYGVSYSPYDERNEVINSSIQDFRLYGFYNYYCRASAIRNSVIERPNMTNFTTTYGIFLAFGSINTVIERNEITNLFAMDQTNSNTCYAIYIQSSGSSNNENIFRNNIIHDINHNGALYAIYSPGYTYSKIEHNTISLDYANATGGVTRGIWVTSGPNTVLNNIVSITRGGGGAKHCLYYQNTNIVSDFNVLYLNAPAGANSIGYYNANFNTLAAWQTANQSRWDQNSSDADPVYSNTVALDYTPTSTVVNNMATPVGIMTDFFNAGRSSVMPDPGAIEFFNTPCFGMPTGNTVNAPALQFCPGMTVNLNLPVGVYQNSGYEVQWVESTSSGFGPFNTVPGATLASHITAPLSQAVWYTAVVTCTNSSLSSTAIAGYLNVAGPSFSTVPYFESFESLAANRLPNCSWNSSSNGNATLTYTTSNTNGRIPSHGTSFASFFNTPAGTNYFYSNGITLSPGITYSASLKWITDQSNINWTDLSILIGQSQSATGAQTVVSTNGPAVSPIHVLLGDTFNVSSPGLYYMIVKATSTAGGAPYLSFDEMRIDIPCDFNSPALSVSGPSVACTGQGLNLIASGANSYTWSNGSNNAAITVTPGISTTGYTVTGTSSLSGCSVSFVKPVNVALSPNVNIIADNLSVCGSQPVKLTAVGASNYNWAHGPNTAFTTVTPSVTTTYSVIGVSAQGCAVMRTQQIVVNALPNISANSSVAQSCAGQSVLLTASGGNSYQWLASTSNLYVGNPVSVSPQNSTSYTVTGTDANGCSNTAIVLLEVNECTSLSENSAAGAIKVFPNPNTGLFTVQMENGSVKNISVVDMMGRTVVSTSTSAVNADFDISQLSNGVYYIRIQADETTQVIKLVKSN